jgi:hypothetical protein
VPLDKAIEKSLILDYVKSQDFPYARD